jgi:hypothetical protein
MLFLVETKGEAAHLPPFAEDLPDSFLDLLRRASSVAALLGPRCFLHLTRYVQLVSYRENFAQPRADRNEMLLCSLQYLQLAAYLDESTVNMGAPRSSFHITGANQNIHAS